MSLRTNFAWTFAGNFVYAVCQWGMLVALAKLGTPEMVGQFALGLAVTAPIMMFTNLQLRGVQATDAKREYSFGDYLGLRLITTIFALLAITGLVLVLGYRQETALIILIVGMAKAFEAISDVFYGLIQQHERMDRIAISMMTKGALSLAALSGLVHLTGSLLWGAVGLAATWALILAFYDVRSGALVLRTASPVPPGVTTQKIWYVDTLRPRLSLSTLSKLSWLALPLGIVMFLISLNTNIPRYFIEWKLGERELGIFAAMAYLMIAGNTVVNALGQSASPRLSQYYAAGNTAAFRSLLLKLVCLGALLGGACILVSIVAGRQILTLLYHPEYAERAEVFLWLMIAAGVGYVASFLGYGMTAARYFKVQMPLFFMVGVTTAIACAILVPGNQSLGAAYAIVVSMILHLAGSLAVVVHAVRSAPARRRR